MWRQRIIKSEIWNRKTHLSQKKHGTYNFVIRKNRTVSGDSLELPLLFY